MCIQQYTAMWIYTNVYTAICCNILQCVYTRPVAMGGVRGQRPQISFVHPQTFLFPEKFLSKIWWKQKLCPSKIVFCPSKPQYLSTGLVYTAMCIQQNLCCTLLYTATSRRIVRYTALFGEVSFIRRDSYERSSHAITTKPVTAFPEFMLPFSESSELVIVGYSLIFAWRERWL